MTWTSISPKLGAGCDLRPFAHTEAKDLLQTEWVSAEARSLVNGLFLSTPVQQNIGTKPLLPFLALASSQGQRWLQQLVSHFPHTSSTCF